MFLVIVQSRTWCEQDRTDVSAVSSMLSGHRHRKSVTDIC